MKLQQHFQKLITRVSGAAVLTLALSACSQGLLGGSVQKNFAGIQSITVLSPYSLDINWTLNSNCDSYQIVQLSSGSSGILQTANLPPVRLRSLLTDHSYTYSVVCVQGTTLSGQDINKTDLTWQQFSGVMTNLVDQTGVNPIINLSWNYPHPGVIYSIYAKQSVVPGDLSTWGLTPNGTGGYTETPICQTGNNTVKLGVGADCNPTFIAGQTYNFKVVATYPDGTKSVDYVGPQNGTSLLYPTTFVPPNCILTSTGVGPDKVSTYLTLRCGASTAAGACPIGQSTVKAFQAIKSSPTVTTRTPVSDLLSGAGTLLIQPQIQAGQYNSRLVQGLELEYTCSNTTPSTKAVIRYDGTGGHIAPTLKYGSEGYEGAPLKSALQAPSGFGGAFAIGDYNCDGKPDLAVGMPKVTYNTAPYFNKNAETGLVKVYYGYTRAANGTIYSDDVQYITFSDLKANSHFGTALASGNINRDVYKNGNTYSCDDLIIGSPGENSSNGAAYIFYGNPQKFQTPYYSAQLQQNAPTCSGTITSKVCPPVRLAPDVNTYFQMDPSHSPLAFGQNMLDQDGFGSAVAFVGDHNADGYGDVAIGAPNTRFFGEERLGAVPPAIAVTGNHIAEVGAVYLYFGGANGLQNVNVGNFSDPARPGAILTPFVTIFPPVPQTGMHFGASISSGGEVDGALPVPVKQNGSNDVILAQGSDFVIGAPGFKYATPVYNVNGVLISGFSQEGGNIPNTLPDWNISAGEGVDPLLLQVGVADGATFSPKVVPPMNGGWTSVGTWLGKNTMPVPTNAALQASSGVAFLYRGRHAYQNYSVGVKTTGVNEFHKFPLQVDASTGLETFLSQNTLDRENGSSFITFPGAFTNLTNPVDSFYNCSNRGNARSWGANGYHHYSCLAGRNNFSIIYPLLENGETGVTGFGQSVAIAGAKDQNAVALYNLNKAGDLPASKFVRDGSNSLVTYSQGSVLNAGGVHDRIRGSSLWEIGISGLNTGSAKTNVGCEGFSVSSDQTTSTCATYSVGRSSLGESFNFPTVDFTSAPNSAPTVDINRDGYADVLVGSAINSGNSAYLYTFFGNYAGDFSYSNTLATPYGAAGSCSVTRSAPTDLTDNSVAFTSALPTLAATKPYSTYYARSAAAVASVTNTHFVASEYPVFPQGTAISMRWLDDLTELGAAYSLNYTDATRTVAISNDAAARCPPQRKVYDAGITNIAVADLNNDGIQDVALGFPSYNGNLGKGVVTYASNVANGLVADITFTSGALNSKSGSAMAANHWRFIDDTKRRDLWVGAPGYKNNGVPGDGAMFNYNAPLNATLTSATGTTLTIASSEHVNSANQLNANFARVIGDVNGDGYDDIMVPIKRYSDGGDVYYDGAIYFGSLYGPITTEYCVANSSLFASYSAGMCEPTVGGGVASINGISVRMPQYLQKPVMASPSWIIGMQRAGDIDHDGKEDVVVIEDAYSVAGTNGSNTYTFFGSDSGLIMGTPQMGPSANHSPQIVSSIFGGIYAGAPTHLADSYHTAGDGLSTLSTWAYTYGDYNGDGYSDIAIGLPGAYGAGYSPGAWNCSAALLATGGNTPGNCASGGTGSGKSGNVVIIYGSPNGLQTPSNSITGVAMDFDGPQLSCTDFYGTCNTTANNTVRSVYTSMTIDTNTMAVTVDKSKTACVPGSAGTAATCKALTVVSNPLHFNGLDTVGISAGMHFGGAITTADINGDGVDDLIVGDNAFTNATDSQDSNSLISKRLQPGNDAAAKGSVFIYYGAKGFGLVAPDSLHYLANAGLGLDQSSNNSPAPDIKGVAFALYPKISVDAGTVFPGLDTVEAGRSFGTSVSAGDFNGDKIDDIAVTSGRGTVYIYYGPICQYDNSSSASVVAYETPNVASPVGNITPASCQSVNLSSLSLVGGNTYSAGQVTAVAKTTNFQTVVASTNYNATQVMGTTLVSRRPARTAAGVFIKNPGNVDGDPDGTSDLVIGTPNASDPNAFITNGKTSGLGYLLFGHKAGGSIQTRPGIYVGTANYNSTITSLSILGVANYFYSPILLKPHTPEGNTEGFFQYETSMGDFNGDGTGDLMFNTDDIQTATDGSPVIFGGGFKLVY